MLLIHAGATLAMVGLIWFVQVVHYPLFRLVGPAVFVPYENAHTRRTAWVVGPFMAVEGITAVLLFGLTPNDIGRPVAFAGLVLLAIIHGSTVFLQVPAHRSLSVAWDEHVAKRLVSSNWIRTIGWSARGLLALAIL
jgi:hypothetical protein